MLISYIKLAWRNLLRKKLYSLINLTGLSVACAFCISVYWYVQHERSFDRFHSKADQLYRLELNDIFKSDTKQTTKGFLSFLNEADNDLNLITTPVILAAELKRNFPEIESTLRLRGGEAVIRVNNQSYKEEKNVVFADPDFFNVFSFPLKEGGSSTVLSSLNQVVISERAAKKYFGDKQAVGQILQVSNMNNALFTVTGVAKDFPINSSLQFDLVFPRESDTWYLDDVRHELNSFTDILILQLKKGANLSSLSQKLDAFGKQYFRTTIERWSSIPGRSINPNEFHFILRPFANAHYNSSDPWPHYTDLSNIYLLIGLSIVMLLIACLNYILITLTGTMSRSKEIGVRKTVGAGRKQIVLQFYMESQLLALIAAISGWLLAIFFLPYFNNLVNANLQPLFFSEDVLLMLIILAVASGTLAGIYPAIVMSGLRPLSMMRKLASYRFSPYLAKALTITQFSACVVLVICALVISRQMRYTNEKDLGFDKDQIVSIQSPYGFEEKQKSFQLRDRLFQYLQAEPAIESITSSLFSYKRFSSNMHVINDEQTNVLDLKVDYNYFSFFKIPIVKGRSFSAEVLQDSAMLQLSEDQHTAQGSAVRFPVVVNETLYKMLGAPPINSINRSLGAQIIGVCKDYYADDLSKKIAPAYHRINRDFVGCFWAKLRAGQSVGEAMDKIKLDWKKLTGGEPFNYAFLDEEVAKSYDAYRRWMKTITICSLISILIACMGLFGISGLTAVNRVKEIGIRKVLGASTRQLFLLLNRGTVIIMILSFMLAMPLAIYLSNEWLQNFAYRIKPDWKLYATAGIINVCTALVAVSYHTIRAATANPVKSLRTE